MVHAPSTLCLKCRRSGHRANECYRDWTPWSDNWFYGSDRRKFKAHNRKTPSNDYLCGRCRDLDIVQFLQQDIPWTSSSGLDRAAEEDGPYLKNIGTVGSTIFQEKCGLCRCLFALTPNPSSLDEKIWLVPDWTMKRLEGGIHTETPEKQKSSKSLLVFLSPHSSLGVNSDAHEGDALCLLSDDKQQPKQSLQGRMINQNNLNFDLIKHWLSQCSKLHPLTCKPLCTPDLQEIRLVDVRARQIVAHPKHQCDYLALSYVWGSTPQKMYQNGQFLKKLPKTIEDAMTFVEKLGKRYLWVDSLSINQEDQAEKLRQIGKMSIIYRGAWATIIALSGSSADAGLTRLGSSDHLVPQVSCTIKGQTLVNLMPTLSNQIWKCPWGQRAWTLQEALLSRRCIYISDHQMYFECNAMQCCESIDETRSWVHGTCRDERFLQNGHCETAIGAGVLRSPFVGSSPANDRFLQYGVLTNLYNYRYMTNESDALNAFCGIIQYLTEVEYKKGFFWGLPLEDMNWALLWSLRYPSDRRSGFPSWSWTGWHGWKYSASPTDIRNTQKLTTSLRIWKKENNDEFESLYETDYATLSSVSKDPLFAIASSTKQSSPSSLFISAPALPLSSTCLFIQGLTFTFTPHLRLSYGKWDSHTRFAQPVSTLTLPSNGETSPGSPSVSSSSLPSSSSTSEEDQKYIEIRILSNDAQLKQLFEADKPSKFVLLARESGENAMYLYVMLLKETNDGKMGDETGIMERGTRAIIAIDIAKMELLAALNPRIESFILA